MNKIVISFAIVACCLNFRSNAQINLVRNGGFEQYYDCPGGWDNIILAKFWTPIDTNGTLVPYTMPLCTPEYDNKCAPSGSLMVIPTNNLFNHYPRSGNGFVSGEMYFDNSYTGEHYQRDYFQGRLFSHLVSGTNYCVTFYVSVAQSAQYAVDHIGAYLDNGSIDVGKDSLNCANPLISFTPQIVGDSIINDTLNWVKIQGSFTATGIETFITIGNFFDIYHTDTLRRQLIYPPWNTGNAYSYYLIDDISVIQSNTIANAGPDQWVSPGSDSVFIGIADEGLPTTWYIVGDSTPICYGAGGFKVHPDTTISYVVALDICDNLTKDTVTIHVAPTIIKDNQYQLLQVAVFPNPTKDHVTISGAENCTATIVNEFGQIMLQSKISSNTETIDITSLPAGIYFVQIESSLTEQKEVKIIFKNY